MEGLTPEEKSLDISLEAYRLWEASVELLAGKKVDVAYEERGVW